MKRFVVCAILTWAASGCVVQGPKCTNDGECPAAHRCNPVSHSCIGIPVDDGTCAPACVQWQFCSETQCHDRYANVVLTTPANGAVVRGTFDVAATISPVATNVPRDDPAQLLLTVRASDGGTVASGDLNRTGVGMYQGQVSGLDDGPHSVVAGFTDGTGTTSAQVTVDATDPVLTIRSGWAPPANRPTPEQDQGFDPAWKRDETTTITVSANEPLSGSPTFTFTGADGGVVTGTLDGGAPSCGTEPYCGSVVLDFAQPAMNAFRGDFSLAIQGTDLAGNVGTVTSQSKVTRLKWVKDLGTLASVRSPSIGANGTIYVASAGTLLALNPDSSPKWTTPIGAMGASPTVGKATGGTETVYVAANISRPLVAISGGDGGVLLQCPTTPISTAGSMAATPLVTQLDGGEAAIGFATGNGDIGVVSIRPTGSPQCAFSGPIPGGSALAPTNVVGFDDSPFVADTSRKVRDLNYSSATAIWSEDTGWPSAASNAAVALAVSNGQIVGGAGPGLFGVTIGGGPGVWTFTAGSVTYPVFAGPAAILFVDETSSRIREVAFGATSETNSANVGGSTSSPLIGQGGIIYLVRVDGQIQALSRNLAPIWLESTGDATQASPTIDCSRDEVGGKRPGRPGTLYIGTESGKLRAIIVDSRGIDTTAPWPKYQRDPRNTGSLSTDMTEFACP